jgi:hypothetical protein
MRACGFAERWHGRREGRDRVDPVGLEQLAHSVRQFGGRHRLQPFPCPSLGAESVTPIRPGGREAEAALVLDEQRLVLFEHRIEISGREIGEREVSHRHAGCQRDPADPTILT